MQRIESFPHGLSFVGQNSCRYSVNNEVSADGCRIKFFAEEMGGNDHVSFNIYRTASKGWTLKPCEMPSQKIFDFVEQLVPDGDDQAPKQDPYSVRKNASFGSI